ncbi:MAG: hypothetical protein LBI79_02660 [Nitrososphaerota archaeon]|nr:hypothetical protein [Nitrososphaerota archaeon]
MCSNIHIQKGDHLTLCSKLQVPLPKKGITIRKTGKHQYVFKVLTTYRDKNGHPTNTHTAMRRRQYLFG